MALFFAIACARRLRRVNLNAVDTLQAAHQRTATSALAHHLLQLFRTQLDFTLADVNGQRALNLRVDRTLGVSRMAIMFHAGDACSRPY